jgi:hypothetical protein
LLKGIALGLLIAAIYAFLLLFMQITLPGVAKYFELCLYGAERNINSCGFPPYILGGCPLQRLYGFASESTTWGMTRGVLFSSVISNSRSKLSSGFVTTQVMSTLATISITAITLLRVMFCILNLGGVNLV